MYTRALYANSVCRWTEIHFVITLALRSKGISSTCKMDMQSKHIVRDVQRLCRAHPYAYDDGGMKAVTTTISTAQLANRSMYTHSEFFSFFSISMWNFDRKKISTATKSRANSSHSGRSSKMTKEKKIKFTKSLETCWCGPTTMFAHDWTIHMHLATSKWDRTYTGMHTNLLVVCCNRFTVVRRRCSLTNVRSSINWLAPFLSLASLLSRCQHNYRFNNLIKIYWMDIATSFVIKHCHR